MAGLQLAGSVVQVTSPFIGQCLIDSIRKQFPRGQTQGGDSYMDRTRHLLQVNLNLIDHEDRPGICIAYEAARAKKAQLGNCSKLQKFLKARDYKCLSKVLYIEVKKASERGIDESLLDQIRRAAGSGPDPPNPFSDPPAPPFTNTSVESLDQVAMVTYRSETTRDVAVALTLHGQDATTQEVIATFPPEVFDNDSTGHGGPAISFVPLEEGDNVDGNVDDDDGR